MRLTSSMFCLALAAAPIAAQTAPAKWADTVSREIDQAYLSGDLAKVQAARALAERVATAFPDDGLILHYQAFALYREGTLVANRGGDSGGLLDRARELLVRSIKTRPLAESHALLSSIDGFLIARDPSRAMELGMAAAESQGAALSMGPSNPRVWLIRGLGSMFTPAEYGGGLSAAADQLRRANELFAKDAPKAGEPSWGRAEAHVWLGQVYEKLNDREKATAEYRAALAIEPGFAWAKSLSQR